MQIDPTLRSALLDLLPVIVGALIALSGGAVRYIVETRARRRQRIAEKLERLLHLANDVISWTEQIDDRYTLGTTSEMVSSPLEEMRLISRIYLPELEPAVNAIWIAALEYKQNALNLARERLASDGALSHELAERISEPYSKLAKAVDHLASKVSDHAKKVL